MAEIGIGTTQSVAQPQKKDNSAIMSAISKKQMYPRQDAFVRSNRENPNQNKTSKWPMIAIGVSLLSTAILALSHKSISNVLKKVCNDNNKVMRMLISPPKPTQANKATELLFEDLTKVTKLEDMALPKQLTETVDKVVTSIQNAEILGQKGGKPVKSILLYGPPGTGKTTFAKALAQRVENAEFVNLDVTQLSSKYVGESEKNIQEQMVKICERAKANPDKKIFVFMDEIDSVMMVDKSSSAKYSNDVLNEFKRGITERFGKHDNIIMVGATNIDINATKAIAAQGKELDQPMLSRFSDKILVDVPTKAQIAKTIAHKYKNLSLVHSTLKSEDSEAVQKIAEFLEGKVSFRTLNSIFSDAALQSKDVKAPVSINDFVNAIASKKDELISNQAGLTIEKFNEDLHNLYSSIM